MCTSTNLTNRHHARESRALPRDCVGTQAEASMGGLPHVGALTKQCKKMDDSRGLAQLKRLANNGSARQGRHDMMRASGARVRSRHTARRAPAVQ